VDQPVVERVHVVLLGVLRRASSQIAVIEPRNVPGADDALGGGSEVPVYTTVEPPYAEAKARVIVPSRVRNAPPSWYRASAISSSRPVNSWSSRRGPFSSTRMRTPSRTRGASSWAIVPPPAPDPMMTMSYDREVLTASPPS